MRCWPYSVACHSKPILILKLSWLMTARGKARKRALDLLYASDLAIYRRRADGSGDAELQARSSRPALYFPTEPVHGYKRGIRTHDKRTSTVALPN